MINFPISHSMNYLCESCHHKYAFWIAIYLGVSVINRNLLILLQGNALISKLTEEKNAAVQQNNKLRQELVRSPDVTFLLCVFCQFSYLPGSVSCFFVISGSHFATT